MMNFQPQKDPLSVPGPQGFGSPNDLPTAQGGDLEGGHELEGRQPTDQQPQSEEHTVVIPGQLITDPESAGWLSFFENFVLGPHERNPIWRLRLLSGFNLYIAIVVGFLFSLGDLHQAAPYHYQVAMLITSVGAPIVVAAIGLFVSFLFSSVPNRQTSWITGLSVANFIMLCGPLSIYWALDTKSSR